MLLKAQWASSRTSRKTDQRNKLFSHNKAFAGLHGISGATPTLREPAKVIKVVHLIPPEAFVASCLGSRRRNVLNLSEEPGAPACRAHLQVAGRVVAAGDSAREEQTHMAGDRPTSCQTGAAGGGSSGA